MVYMRGIGHKVIRQSVFFLIFLKLSVNNAEVRHYKTKKFQMDLFQL